MKNMRKTIIILGMVLLLAACGRKGKEPGKQKDILSPTAVLTVTPVPTAVPVT